MLDVGCSKAPSPFSLLSLFETVTQTLIIKLGATGDVVRTTPLLRRLEGPFTWITAAKNKPLLEGLDGLDGRLQVYSWEERAAIAGRHFDLAVSLEDEPDTAAVLSTVTADRIFGAYRNGDGHMTYSSDSHRWFDLSLISSHGRQRADELKFLNRVSYQELVFEGLGLEFRNDAYLLPPTPPSPLSGDVAIAPEAGAVWPMKRWAHYDRLKAELESRGLTVNVLPTRATLLEHLADVRGHRCVVCGDSLPMHLALGSGIQTVALFNCTSPWEIHDYGLLTKLVSPLLGEFFYKRAFDPRATTAIPFSDVMEAVVQAMGIEQKTRS
jgi:heptosyltransferase II